MGRHPRAIHNKNRAHRWDGIGKGLESVIELTLGEPMAHAPPDSQGADRERPGPPRLILRKQTVAERLVLEMV